MVFGLILVGCTDVTGGAVELSWRFRPEPGAIGDQKFVECNPDLPGTGKVRRIKLDWSVGSDSDTVQFDCEAHTGATGFDLPAGTALIAISPVCDNGAPEPSTFTAPAALQRTVVVGDTISLGAVELLLQISNCSDQPCICHP